MSTTRCVHRKPTAILLKSVYCYVSRLLWEIAAGAVHNQKENRVPLPYNVCTHPSLQWRVCIYSKEKRSPISIVGLASSRDSRSSLAILNNKGKRIRTTTNQENKKNLTRCRSPSKFEEQAFKEKDYRMLINSYCLRWWRGKAEKETQPGFYHHTQGLLRTFLGHEPAPKGVWFTEMNQ